MSEQTQKAFCQMIGILAGIASALIVTSVVYWLAVHWQGITEYTKNFGG